jgi:Fur family ferric uptake transcriptional regulator
VPSDVEGHGAADSDELHAAAERRLARVGQRHTKQRRAILDAVAAAGRPVSIADLRDGDGAVVSQSSLYRNLVVLEGVGVLQRVTGSGNDRFELSEALSGHHHHHLTCIVCGLVTDIPADPAVERAVAREARKIARAHGATITGHSLDLYGRCADCRR